MQGIFEKLSRYFNNKWHLSVLDSKAGRWIVDAQISNIPYLKAENANGRHVLIQPHPQIEQFYLLADDLTWDTICVHHRCADTKFKPGRMIVETSPDNFQVWIHSSRLLTLDEKRFWLKKLKSDPGADPNHRWGRCPGFRNRKKKYRDSNGHYPLARLVWVDWHGKADIPNVNISKQDHKNTFSNQPLGGVCHIRPIFRKNYERGDESATDFSFAIALALRGYSESEIMSRILADRKDWTNHSGSKRKLNYIKITVRKAKSIVGKN